MSEIQAQPETRKTIVDAAELEIALADLQKALEQQMKLLTDEDYDGFIAAGEAVTELLTLVTNTEAQFTWQSLEIIRKIYGLHHTLSLTLAAKSEEMAEGMSKMRSGKNVLKAYKG